MPHVLFLQTHSQEQIIWHKRGLIDIECGSLKVYVSLRSDLQTLCYKKGLAHMYNHHNRDGFFIHNEENKRATNLCL